MTKKEIIKELREILKVYHYDSDTENMSKDVVIALENLINPPDDDELPEEILVKTWEMGAR